MDCNKQNCISGIKCEVANCCYHTEKNECTAGKIEVGNFTATENDQTQCNTFKCQ